MRALFIGLLIVGCYDPDTSRSMFLCRSECQPGFSCVGGSCVRTEADGGPHSTEPGIKIVEPEEGAELDATSAFDLVVEITNFTLQQDQLAEPVEGEGHWHWFIDEFPDIRAYQSSSSDLSVTVGPQTPGCRLVTVDLRQNRHAPLDPPRSDAIGVRLVDGGPIICIEAPPREETFTEGLITVTVDVQNFVLDDTDAEGHGHWHVSIDGEQTEDHFAASSGTVSIAAGEEPTRLIVVELVSNNETPIDPPRRAWVPVKVLPE